MKDTSSCTICRGGLHLLTFTSSLKVHSFTMQRAGGFFMETRANGRAIFYIFTGPPASSLPCELAQGRQNDLLAIYCKKPPDICVLKPWAYKMLNNDIIHSFSTFLLKLFFQENPRGLYVTVKLMVSFHKMFITKVDKVRKIGFKF